MKWAGGEERQPHASVSVAGLGLGVPGAKARPLRVSSGLQCPVALRLLLLDDRERRDGLRKCLVDVGLISPPWPRRSSRQKPQER